MNSLKLLKNTIWFSSEKLIEIRCQVEPFLHFKVTICNSIMSFPILGMFSIDTNSYISLLCQIRSLFCQICSIIIINFKLDNFNVDWVNIEQIANQCRLTVCGCSKKNIIITFPSDTLIDDRIYTEIKQRLRRKKFNPIWVYTFQNGSQNTI